MSRSQSAAMCSIALNALCAGGIFTFPLLSPAMATHVKLSQPELTTIALAGMMSQYTVAAMVGKVVDTHGPSVCSLIAAFLFAFGFGAFSYEIYTTPPDIVIPSSASFHRLTFFFFLAGLGTVFSYFSSLFAASKAFPRHLGLASGVSMALFGLSPLFLSVVASKYFTDPQTKTLDVSQFMLFLAILTTTVYLLGAVNLRNIIPDSDSAPERLSSSDVEEDIRETTALLPKPTPTSDPTVADLLRSQDFWLLMVFCILTLGASEMIICNIGTIVLSLPGSDGPLPESINVEASTNHQVRLLSLANTISRIIIGPLADYVSPITSSLTIDDQTTPRKHRINRIAFLTGAAVVLAATFFWMVTQVTSREAIWTLSVGTGLGYSTIFTVMPSIISSMWGIKNVGRNFGLLMYAPFTGNPIFSYMYAFVSDAHSHGYGICEGRDCWQLTFWVSFGALIVSCLTSLVLWNRWKGSL